MLAGGAWFHFQGADGGGDFAAFFFDIIDGARDDAAFGAIEEGGFLGDDVFFEAFEAGVVEVAPAEGVAGLDDFVEALAFAFAEEDGFLGAEVVRP